MTPSQSSPHVRFLALILLLVAFALGVGLPTAATEQANEGAQGSSPAPDSVTTSAPGYAQEAMLVVDVQPQDAAELLQLQELGIPATAVGVQRLEVTPEQAATMKAHGIATTVLERAVKISMGPIVIPPHGGKSLALGEEYQYASLQTDRAVSKMGQGSYGYGQSAQTITGAPAGSKVSRVHYRLRVVHDRLNLIFMEFKTDPFSGTEVRPWNFQGGATDGGYDDDAEDDNDVEIDDWIDSQYDGIDVNAFWLLAVFNNSSVYAGTIDYLEFWIYYEVAGEPSPTPTATRTPTLATSPTRTKTPTNSPTRTKTPTNWVSPTRTKTPVNQPTRTLTPTRTPTRTRTPTALPNPLRPVHGVVYYNGEKAPSGSLLKAKSDGDWRGSAWTGVNGSYQVYVSCTDRRPVTFQLTPPNKSAVDCQTTWTCAAGNPQLDLWCGDNLPDFVAGQPRILPESPKVPEQVMLTFPFENQGAYYVPTFSTRNATVSVNIRAPSTHEVWSYTFIVTIPPLAPDTFTSVDCGPIFFTSDRITSVEWTLSSTDAERSTANNTGQLDYVYVQPVEHALSCVMLPIDCALFWVDLNTFGQTAFASEVISELLVQYTPSLCDDCVRSAPACLKLAINFAIDVAIKVGEARVKNFNPLLAVVSMGKNLWDAYWAAMDCGSYLGDAARIFQENVKYRDLEVDMAAVQSPAYVLATDQQGRQSGFAANGNVVAQIPGTETLEKNGHRLVIFPSAGTKRIDVYGAADAGSALSAGGSTFDLLIYVNVGKALQHLQYSAVPVTAASRGYVDIQSGDLRLAMDDNGDGRTDRYVGPSQSVRTYPSKLMLPIIRK